MANKNLDNIKNIKSQPLKVRRNQFLLPLSFACCLVPFVLVKEVRAEGSVNLIGSGGDRPYLEYRVGAVGDPQFVTAGIARRTTIKVYAEPGETINLGSSALNINGGRINYRDPNNTAGSCALGSDAGEIDNLTEELTGPFHPVTNNNVNAYIPCTVTVGATQGGIWEIDFVSPNQTNTNSPPLIAANAAWGTQGVNNNFVTAWDVTVRNAGGTAISGRAYANYFALNAGAGFNGRISSETYIQTVDGYRYRVDLNGLQPAGFVFFVNNKGFTDTGGNALYQSIGLVGPSNNDLPATVAPIDVINTQKIFLNIPDPGMPTTANSPTNPSEWLLAPPAPPPTPTDFQFVGVEGTSGQAGTTPLGGNFSFNAPSPGSYTIKIDVNQDGDYDDPIDRILTGTATSGNNVIFWEGNDGLGNPVPPSITPYGSSITLNAGEVHFPFIDVENNTTGLIIQRQVPGVGLNPFTIYYDDDKPGFTTTGQSAPSPLSALTGIDSSAGAHSYGTSSVSTEFGNNRGIDTWTYLPSDPITLVQGILITQADLTIAKTDNVTTIPANSPITYTITVTNNGPSNLTGTNAATVTDPIPASMTGVTWTCAITTGTGTCNAASGSGNNINTTVQLNSGAIATYTVTGTVDLAAVGETLTNTATVRRPNDVTDLIDNDSSGGTNTTESATDTDTVVTPPSADLGIVKTDNQTTTTPGSATTYTITVTNNGPSTVNSVTVTDAVPASILSPTFTPSTGSYNSGTGAWTGLNLASGQSITLTINGTVDPTATGIISNTATVAPPTGVTDPNNANNSNTDTTTINPTADLGIVKTDNQTNIAPGSAIAYTVTVTNNGPSTVNSVTVTDAVPASILSPTFTPSTGSYNSGTGAWTGLNLASGQSITLTINGTVDPTATGTITNTATVAPPTGVTDPNNANDSSTDTTTINPTADLGIVKTDNQTTTTPGSAIAYTVTVTNNGPSTVNSVTVADAVPASILSPTFTPSTGSYNSGTGAWTGLNLASGQSITLTINGTVDPTATGTITNTATVAPPTGVTDPNNANDSSTDTTTINPTADLGIVKTDNQTTTTPGSAIAYTVTVTNNGPSTVNSVTVTDAVPASILSPTFTPSTGTYNSGTGAWTGLNLATGQSITLTINGTVDPTATGTITNTATVAPPAGVTDPNNANDSSTDTTDLTPTADLAIVKTDNQTSIAPGSAIAYTITVTNNGTSTVNSVTVTDVVPASILSPTFTPSTGSYNSGTGAWTGLNLATGQSITLTINGTVDPTATGTITNTATVAPPTGVTDPNNANNTSTDTTTIAPTADLSIVKTDNKTSIAPGSATTYTITVTNNGTSTVNSVTVTDAVPASIQNPTFTASTGTYNATTGAWTGLNLATGQSITLTIAGTVAANATGTIANTATVAPPAGVTDPNNANNTATDTTTITTAPLTADLAIAKTDNQANTSPGSAITYTITVTNNGTSTVNSVTVTDTVPASIQNPVFTASTGTYNATTGAWTGLNLATGQSITLTIAGTVAANATGTITNTATVAPPAGVTDPNNANNTATDTTTITSPGADLSLAKTVNNFNPKVGDRITYTLTVTNSGPLTATNVQVTDQLPAGLTFESANASGTFNPVTREVVWNVASIANNATASLTITATVTSTNSLTNSAEITASDQPDPDSTPGNNLGSEDDRASITIPQEATADLSINKIVDNPNPTVGQTITYTIALTNQGTSNATGVQVTDQVPAGLTFLNATASQGTYDSSTGLWTVGDLANAATATLTIAARVNTANQVINTAQVTASDQPDPDPSDNSSSVSVPQQAADLSLTKTANTTTPTVGQNITYTITLSNAGPGTATDVAVTDKLPDGLNFISATPSQGSYNSNTGVWTVGNVANGANATLTVTALVNTSSAITNSAEITASDQPDPNPNNNTDSVTLGQQQADLSVSKIVDNPNPTPGQNINYTVRLTNSGPNTATGVQITEQLPAGLTFVSATPSVGTYNNATGVWSVSSLGSGASVTLRITATLNAPNATNTVKITASDQSDPDLTDNQASVTVPTQGADLSLSKTLDNFNATPGQNITYTVTLSNAGPANATGVQVTEQLPAGLTFVSATPSVGTYNNATGIWSVPNLANGASATLRITATLNSANRITNTAAVTASDQPDPDSTPGNSNDSEDDQASVTFPLQETDLSIKKTVDNSNPAPGNTINYTVTVTNSGPANATGVQVSEDLPNGLTLVSQTPSQGSYNPATGLWNVGAIANGASATLRISATLNTTNVVTNTASLSASDQTDTNPNNNRASVSVPNKPNLRLVKRITAMNSTQFNDVVDDPADLNDNATNWPSNYLLGRTDGGKVKPGDVVEYTIYFLSDGGTQAANVNLCDLVPAKLNFVADAFAASQGISVLLNGTQVIYTNAADGDRGQFYPAGTLVPVPPGGQPPQPCSAANTNGAVVVNLGNIPTATGSNPANSYGFVRFRARFVE